MPHYASSPGSPKMPVPGNRSIEARGKLLPNFPRLRALALFGRRPPEPVGSRLSCTVKLPLSSGRSTHQRELSPVSRSEHNQLVSHIVALLTLKNKRPSASLSLGADPPLRMSDITTRRLSHFRYVIHKHEHLGEPGMTKDETAEIGPPVCTVYGPRLTPFSPAQLTKLTYYAAECN